MMKDVLKRILIVGIFLFCVIAVLQYFSTKVEKEKKSGNINPEDVTSEVEAQKAEEPVAIELETDEIEIYDNSKARVNTTLNFRTEPTIESESMMQLQPEDIVDVKAKIRNGWYRVEYDSKSGYLSGEYISILSEDEIKEITVVETYKNEVYAVTNVELNIRKRANKQAEYSSVVLSGSILRVYQRMANDWYRVEGNTIEGYVSGEYIKILSAEEYKSYSSSENNMINPDSNVIATYTAKGSYNENSRFNMHKAADYINGTIVEPGKSYSHLHTIHPNGGGEGYLVSTVFVDGTVTKDTGGGICLTSSTLHAAIASAEEKGIHTGLVISAQKEHSIPVGYVPRRFEATVAMWSQDFSFRNCNDYSIRIDASYSGNTLTIKIVKV